MCILDIQQQPIKKFLQNDKHIAYLYEIDKWSGQEGLKGS